MKRFVVLVCAAAALGASSNPISTTQAAVRSGSGRYTSDDRHFSFTYPAAWSLENHWGESQSFLTNFVLGEQCCDLSDGQLKIDFWSTGVSDAGDARLLYESRCARNFGEQVESCTTLDLNGTRWGWVWARSTDGPASSFYALATRSARAYIAVAFIPDGSHSEQTRRAVERVFRSFTLG